nr:uncharacterized protein LOC109190937 [Ipomoea batatas]
MIGEEKANLKKRVRVKPKKVPVGPNAILPAAPDGTLPNATLPLQEVDDDSWLTNIDIDAVVSQLLPNPTI